MSLEAGNSRESGETRFDSCGDKLFPVSTLPRCEMRVKLIVAALALVFFGGGRAFSQDRPAAPNAPDAASSRKQNSQSSQSGAPEQKTDQEAKERIFGIFPAFNVSNQVDPVPLTKGQKFKLFARSTYDPVTLIAPVFKVPILQAVEGDNGFGTGLHGFATRYGVSLADGTSSRFFRQFLFPAILKEDPRFFRRGHGTFGSRLRYSLSRLFVTRTDAGGSRFNWSRLLGSASSAGLSNAYYPESQRGKTTTLFSFGLSYLSEASANVVKEFAPDISRKVRRQKSPEPAPTPI
jgi:hypothetical protein